MVTVTTCGTILGVDMDSVRTQAVPDPATLSATVNEPALTPKSLATTPDTGCEYVAVKRNTSLRSWAASVVPPEDDVKVGTGGR